MTAASEVRGWIGAAGKIAVLTGAGMSRPAAPKAGVVYPAASLARRARGRV